MLPCQAARHRLLIVDQFTMGVVGRTKSRHFVSSANLHCCYIKKIILANPHHSFERDPRSIPSARRFRRPIWPLECRFASFGTGWDPID